ncbi:MAG TPA: sugar phosphate nucleotidyltransferase [Chitinophagaceae bacterium]
MKAMIFSAGLGTRFKPWTDKHPKALAVIHKKTLLQRNIEYLQQFDITDVVINVHHFPEQVIKAIEKNKGWGSNIMISDESDALLDTGGGLMKAKELLNGDEAFLTINADILTELNIKHFLSFHQQQNALISLAVMNRKTSRYLLFNKYDRLIGWRNTTTGEEKIVIHAKDIFEKAYSGIALFEQQVFDLVKRTGKFSLIDMYLDLAEENKIAGYDHTGDRFVDVGKPEGLTVAEQMFS